MGVLQCKISSSLKEIAENIIVYLQGDPQEKHGYGDMMNLSGEELEGALQPWWQAATVMEVAAEDVLQRAGRVEKTSFLLHDLISRGKIQMRQW